MGFFDFVSSAVGAVKNLITQSPIVKSLAPLAGIVAHAVPMVGPIIDNAVPAIDAIFSKDNAAPNPGEDPKPPTSEQLNAPVLVELKRQEQDIKAILATVTDLQHGFDASIANLEKDFKEHMTVMVQQVEAMFSRQLYNSLYTAVREAGTWMADRSKTSLVVTASDDLVKFNPLLVDSNNLIDRSTTLETAIGHIQTEIEKPVSVPSQQMLDLYLLAIHWLLIFNKAIIVTRGIYARALYVDGQNWTQYLDTINKLDGDINTLRNNAIRARDVLQSIVENIPKDRESKIKFLVDGGKKYVQDEWPTLSVGWIPVQSMRKELGFDEKTELVSFNGLVIGDINSDIVVHLWKEYAVQAVDFSLKPARAVIASLEENIRQWNSRIPVSPSKNLPAGENHITADAGRPKTPSEAVIFSVKNEGFSGRKLRYLLTYCNAFGESFSSPLSKEIKITEKIDYIKLTLYSVTFDNDPISTLPLVTGPDGKSSEPDRNISRRIYVRYTESHGTQDVKVFLGEVNGLSNIVYHHLLPAE